MNVRRREALGRNRRGPPVNGTMTALIIGCVILGVLAAVSFKYFTQPERVYGHKMLNCPVHEISWEGPPSARVIRGCGGEVRAHCSERGCGDSDQRVVLENPGY